MAFDPLVVAGVDEMRRRIDLAFVRRLAGAEGEQRRRLVETQEAMHQMVTSYHRWGGPEGMPNGFGPR